MTVYLVDFENVRSEGLRGVENLSEDDKVVIFYSVNADAITFDVHMLLSRSRAEIETFRILRGGRNSLDFQLSTYLGYLVMENRYRHIVIVSQDKGFLCATSFWDANQELCNADIRMRKSILADLNNDYQSNYFENEYEGKFIERVAIIHRKTDSQQERVKVLGDSKETKGRELKGIESKVEKVKDNERNAHEINSVEIKKHGVKVHKPIHDKTITEKAGSNDVTDDMAEKAKKVIRTSPVKKGLRKTPQQTMKIKSHQKMQTKTPPQNPTSKNKIFAAEVKLNITEDIREIIGEKYGEKIVPFLVEVIGKSTGKQHLYRMLVSRLGQEQGHEIYMMIKGQYANLKRK